jgi:uncharacterized protein involved in exopolysaccharide biosynthesis/Mrp family chromosome partitioning ATPase
MLDRPWAAVPAEKYAYETPKDSIDLVDILSFLKRYSRTLVAFPLIALVCTAIYLITSQSIYLAQTQILIEPRIPQLLQQPAAAEVNLSLDTSFVESQLALLRSQKIAKMVVDELKLVDNPDFSSLKGPGLAERVGLFFGLLRDLALDPGERPASPRVALREQIKAENPKATPEDLEQRAIEIVAQGINVNRVGVSYAVDIWSEAKHPDLAARIANAVAHAFVREQLETRSANSREGIRWLEQRIQEVRTQMNYATQAAQRFRAKHDYRVQEVPPLAPSNGVLFEAPKGDVGQGPSLEELEVAAETYRKMYESQLQAYATTVNQQPYLIANARVINVATQPLAPSYPRPKITLAFALLTGLIVGIVVAFLRHSLDGTIRTGKQIREETDLPFLCALPLVKFSRGGFGRLDEVMMQPYGFVRDALTNVKAALAESAAGKPSRCIGVTSVSAGDGKSTVVSNLAALYSVSGKRTLVIDADVNTPLTAELLHEQNTRKGPASPPASLEDRIKFVASTGFYILPMPTAPRGKATEPASLEAVLRRLDAYQMIIVDLPSFSARVGRELAAEMDSVIVVADAGRTLLDHLADMGESLRRGGANLVGVILMRANLGSERGQRRQAARAER